MTQQMKDLLIIDHVKHTRKYLPQPGTRKLHHMLGGFFQHHNIKMGRDKLFDLLLDHNLLIREKDAQPRLPTLITTTENI